MRILLTNDDGYYSDGIQTLAQLARQAGHDVWLVAPDREQSACSHKLTLHEPLRMERMGHQAYAVNGTPTDCIYLARFHLMSAPPDLLISGINRGPNMGDDLTYSGTVAGAMEGAVVGIPSLSVSLASYTVERWDTAARASLMIGRLLRETPLPSRTFLNVNVPAGLAPEDIRLRVTRLGRRDYKQSVFERHDPRGKPYYWIGGDALGGEGNAPDTDIWAVENGYVSVTPITLDMTDTASLSVLAPFERLDLSRLENT